MKLTTTSRGFRDVLANKIAIAIVHSPVRTAVIAAALICSAATIARFIIDTKYLFADFAVFWTAARFDQVYDAEALTRAQQWFLPPDPRLRPFAYPPTFLLLLKPLAWLSFRTALAAWTVLSVVCAAAAFTAYGRRGLLSILSATFGVCIIAGQTSLFLGPALAAAVVLINKRPGIAGILFGLLGTIKPQFAALVPLALIVGRHWNVMAVTLASGAATIIASLLLGPSLWMEWYNSLGVFLHEVQGKNLESMNVAPGLMFAPLGILTVGYVWWTTEAPELRLLGLVGGTVLSVPYFMNYDLVAMAPAASVLLFSQDWRKWIVGFFGFAVLWFSPFIVAIGATFLAWREATERPQLA